MKKFNEKFPSLSMSMKGQKWGMQISGMLIAAASFKNENIIEMEQMHSMDDMNTWISKDKFYPEKAIMKHCVDRGVVANAVVDLIMEEKIIVIGGKKYIQFPYHLWKRLEKILKP